MEKYQKNREILIKRLLYVIAGFLILLLFFDKASLSIILGVIILALAYAFGRDKIWILLVLVIPGLIFGKVLYIPVTDGWVYEARLAEIFLGLIFAVFILDIFLHDKSKLLKIDRLSAWLYLYLIASLLSLGLAHDFRLFVFGLKAVAYSFLAYFLAINLLDTAKKIHWFLYGLASTAIVLSAQIFYKFYQMGFSSDFFFNRSSILIPIAPIATTAAILALIAPVLLAFYFELANVNRWKPIIFLGFFMSFLAVFLTLGKGAIGSFFIGLFYVFYNFKSKRLAFSLFFMWFIAFTYFGFTPYFTGLLERMQTVFIDTNTSFRLNEYEIGWDLIKGHPWFGVGIGQQIYYYQKILDQEQGNYVNNFVLQAVIDLGAVGLVLLIFIMKNIFSNLKKALRLPGKKPVLLTGFIAALIVAFFNGMVEVTFYALPYAIIFWLIVGVFVNAQHITCNTKHAK